MRNTIRLIIFAAIVAAIAVTIAPPVRTSAEAGAPGGSSQDTLVSADRTGRHASRLEPRRPELSR